MNKETLDHALTLNERIDDLAEHKRRIVVSSNMPNVIPEYDVYLGSNSIRLKSKYLDDKILSSYLEKIDKEIQSLQKEFDAL